jgi:mycothiol synthase
MPVKFARNMPSDIRGLVWADTFPTGVRSNQKDEVPIVYVQRFDPKTASDPELADVHRFSRRIQAERVPDDPPFTYEGFAANVRNVPPFITLVVWIVRAEEGGGVIGRANLVIQNTDENQHLGHFDVMVLPEYRRRGIGSELLGLVASAAREADRRLLMTSSTSTVPAAPEFLREVGAKPSLAGHTNILQLKDVDRELLRSWQKRARERASEYELHEWEGRYPEDRMDDVTAMYEAFNTMPMGDLEIEAEHYTPQRVRELDAMYEARGIMKWTVYVEHQDSGIIAGFTEIFIDRRQPKQAYQGLTGVFPEHRNRGLGRWLKAAITEKVLVQSPQTTEIKTDNADINEAMLNINRELGFKPVVADMIWQVSVERAQAYAGSRPRTLVVR